MKRGGGRIGTHEAAVVVTVAYMVALGLVAAGVLGEPSNGFGSALVLDTAPADGFLAGAGGTSRPSAVEEGAGLRRLLGFTGVALGLSWLVGLAGLVILQLGRATARLRDYAVRSALGSSPFRLLRHVLRDTSGALFAGGLLGVGAGSFGLMALLASWPHRLLGSPVELPGPVSLAGAVGIPVLVGIASVALPALGMWRSRSLSRSLGAAGVTPARGAGVARLGLALGQVAVTIALLMGAGALASGLRTGMPATEADVRSIPVRLPAQMSTGEALDRVLSGLGEGVKLSVAGRAALLNLGERVELTNECGLCPRGTLLVRFSATDARAVPVGPSFFDTAGVAVVAGREFNPGDHADSAPVAIVNETFARDHFQDGDPLGRLVTLDGGFGRSLRVVGVVADRPARAIGLRLPVRPTLYLSALQYESTALEVVVGEGGPGGAELEGAVRRAGLLPMGPVRTLAERVRERFEPMGWLLRLVLVAAAAGFVAAVLGLYAVIGNLTRIRRRELALRLSVGARRRSVVWLVLRWTLGVVLWGLLLGTLVGSAMVSRIRILGSDAPFADPVALPLAWAALLCAGLLGAAAPLARVLRVAPAEVLRDDRN